jgi:hypothetical protein
MPLVRNIRRLAVAAVLAINVALGSGVVWAQAGGSPNSGGPNGVLGSAILLSADADQLVCFVSNIGSSTLEIDTVLVRNGGNLFLSLDFNTCSAPSGGAFQLQPNANCTFAASLDARRSARGIVQFRGRAQELRGQCQLTTSNNIIATTELR